jgi:hypothetical protein
MSILKLTYSGTIHKVEHKEAAGKKLCEVSVFKKHKGRNGAEDAYTWVRATIWDCPEFLVPRLVKGNLITFIGDAQLRSFESKGEKGKSLECRVSSFDVEVSEAAPRAAQDDAPALPPTAAAAVKREKAQVAAVTGDYDEPPF